MNWFRVLLLLAGILLALLLTQQCNKKPQARSLGFSFPAAVL